MLIAHDLDTSATRRPLHVDDGRLLVAASASYPTR
jgi:hypothetical protein